MASQTALKLELGLEVYKGDWEGAEWTISGNARRAMTVKEFDSAYDFQEFVQEKINCKGVSFDSEYCQFFAYAKTKARAIKFANDIDKYFAKVRSLLE
jgi:hypothetical protein